MKTEEDMGRKIKKGEAIEEAKEGRKYGEE